MAVSINKQGMKKFIEKWTGRGKEDEDDRSFWIDLFQDVFSQSGVTDRLDFQKKVIGPDGNTKRIDVYVPETNVLIEQKSLGIALDKSQTGHNGMTPYEQAKMYDNGLPRSEKARWIVTSNFSEIWIYDMEKRKPEEDIIKVSLQKLENDYPLLQFLFDSQVEQIRRELKVSQEAGERIGSIYEALLSQIPGEPTEDEYKSLNLFCVRLVFCYYAEDAGLFGKYQFRNYVKSFNTKHLRNGLKDLFRVLDTKEENRDRNDEPELLDFPYVNGGLFADRNLIIPQIDEKTHELMTQTSDFNWSEISPTIFGAVFESTLNQETRRKGGMHYTSIENIHKVIDPLFLDELKEEYKTITEYKQPNVKRQKLKEYQNKLGSLKFLDPACGSGNFLTETYLSLRKIENEVIKDIIALEPKVNPNQIALPEISAGESTVKVTLSQFYGIEINDYAVSVAKTALWIAESQMLKETEEIVSRNIDFLPLKSYVNIIEGNALQIDWKDVLSPEECSFVMGNPPFVGGMKMNAEQKADIKAVVGSSVNGVGEMDYVCGWYYVAVSYIDNTSIECAFVSTNSIVQGQQAITVWEPLMNQYGLYINFAYRTFKWSSESADTAVVHCVIIGFSKNRRNQRFIVFENGKKEFVTNINSYLTNSESIFVHAISSPLSGVPPLRFGSMPRGKDFILSPDERDSIIEKYPSVSKYIRPFYMGREFVDGTKRYCLWLVDASPSEIKHCPPIVERIEAVREARLNSDASATRKMAATPTLFAQIAQPDSDYIAIPAVTTQRREYIPIGFLSKDIIAGNKLYIVAGATIYHFGVLTSSIHMAWMRLLAGRMKSDYSYSKDIVYNNFPWPTPSDEQKGNIIQTAQAIINARNLYQDSSLSDLYDPLTMPVELRKAHEANDKAVMRAYGFSSDLKEYEIVDELMRMYQKMLDEKK